MGRTASRVLEACSGWIFAYGSLVWRPGFSYVERRAGHAEGWARRFWQGSYDHRGRPGAPGRVLTLMPEPRERCSGFVFRVDPICWEAVVAYLDHRERGGYVRQLLDVTLDCQTPIRALTYVAPEGNPNYLGPAELVDIAIQVVESEGPSGSNAEYVLRLAQALDDSGHLDDHVRELAEAVKTRLAPSSKIVK